MYWTDHCGKLLIKSIHVEKNIEIMKEKMLQRVTIQIQRLWATPVSNASEAHFRAEELTRLVKIKDKLYDTAT